MCLYACFFFSWPLTAWGVSTCLSMSATRSTPRQQSIEVMIPSHLRLVLVTHQVFVMSSTPLQILGLFKKGMGEWIYSILLKWKTWFTWKSAPTVEKDISFGNLFFQVPFVKLWDSHWIFLNHIVYSIFDLCEWLTIWQTFPRIPKSTVTQSDQQELWLKMLPYITGHITPLGTNIGLSSWFWMDDVFFSISVGYWTHDLRCLFCIEKISMAHLRLALFP